uniref:Uncharacterized protein n=1 Tax=Anguilla anguilla TaxID=7936 RepID=A0A0E9SVQ4_ANGAN
MQNPKHFSCIQTRMTETKTPEHAHVCLHSTLSV